VIAVIGLLVGIAVGLLWHPVIPVWAEPYLPIAIVAAIDAVVGGFRAIVERRFDERIFVVSFLSNILIAAILVFLGDQLGVGAQMSTGVVVVLAMRIFANAAAIRRLLFRA
jgi:small basic protein